MKKGKSLAGYWEFSGGKIENGESHKDALVRELTEELNMELVVKSTELNTITQTKLKKMNL